MKFFGKIVLGVVLLLAASGLGYAQAPDSCLYIIPDSLGPSPGFSHMNRDSVALDTCRSSATYNHWYSKRFNVDFKVNAFHLGYGKPDSILIVHWENIDTIYKALRDSFHFIYNKWGLFYFQKTRPEDTSVTLDRFKMIFDDYHLTYGYDNQVSYGGVLNDLDTLWTITGQIEAGFSEPIGPPDIVQKNNVIVKNLLLQPNPSSSKLTIKRCDNKPINHIELYNVLGKKVFERNTGGTDEIEINVHSLPDGWYIASCDALKVKVLIAK